VPVFYKCRKCGNATILKPAKCVQGLSRQLPSTLKCEGTQFREIDVTQLKVTALGALGGDGLDLEGTYEGIPFSCRFHGDQAYETMDFIELHTGAERSL